ncbi:hypothetical protein BLOT_007789 [Blomia tropicalis]|nr:hypothetical protein BLOT_007789 [Blomia tropicalis]
MDLSYDWADEFTCIYKLSHVSNDDDKFKGMDLARSIRYQPTVSKDIRSLGLVFIKGQRLKDIGPSHIKNGNK